MNYGRYRIEGELGRGSMGIVYTAHDPNIDRLVALKVLRQDRVSSEEFVQRFLKEAKAIGRLSHPNIVTVYDTAQDHGTVYIAMQFLDGKPLNEIIAEKRLSLKEIVDLGVQVAEALDYVHSRGIVHRDIKPSNIFLTSANRPIITDFGIARIEDPCMPQQTQAGEILGTPVYMSPEQVLCRPVDGRSDLYSLGVILYELTTRRRPFKGESLAAIFKAVTQDTPVEPMKVDPSVSKGLSSLIMKSLKKNPDDRIRTGKDMAEALNACLDEVERKAVTTRPPRKKRLAKTALFILIALIGLGVAGGVYYYFFVWPQAVLGVSSMPKGAQVFLDGSSKGETPLKLRLRNGKYQVRVKKKGYHEWEAQVQLDRGDEVPVFARLLPLDEERL